MLIKLVSSNISVPLQKYTIKIMDDGKSVSSFSQHFDRDTRITKFSIMDSTFIRDVFPVAINTQRFLGWRLADNPVYSGYEFEKVNVNSWSEFMVENRNYAYYAGAIYIVTIFGLKAYMRDKEPLNLRLPLFLWNLFLGIGSIAAFVRIAPGLLAVVFQPNGLHKSICVKEGMDIPTLYWWIMFTLSKFVELGHTVFIVLRKRPLVFLQWYNHLITLWAVWLTAPLGEPIIRWMGGLNTGVHSLMYPYFAMKAIGMHVPSPFVNFITTCQLAQMLVGFVINVASWYFDSVGHNCVRHPLSINTFIFVYGSFIFLFGKLFYDSVIKGARKRREKGE